MSETSPPVLRLVNDELARAVGADMALSWGFSVHERVEIDFFYPFGFTKKFEGMMEAHLSATPGPFGNFHPARPERWQRNRVCTLREVERRFPDRPPAPVVRDLYPKIEVDDHYRVLVCDGPALLAYIGIVNRGAEIAPSKHGWILRAVLPALRQRLTVERLLGFSGMWVSAVASALEHVPSAAVVVARHGAVRYANAVAKRWLDDDPCGFVEELRASMEGGAGSFAITRLRAAGVPPHWLAVHQAPAREAFARAAVAAERWGVTRRQREVLELVAAGKANKTIASTLRCAENTVELHVGGLLRRAGVGTRAELIVKVWRGA